MKELPWNLATETEKSSRTTYGIALLYTEYMFLYDVLLFGIRVLQTIFSEKIRAVSFCEILNEVLNPYTWLFVLNGMIALPNFIKIYKFVQKLMGRGGGEDRHQGDLVSLFFLFYEGKCDKNDKQKKRTNERGKDK